LFGRRFRPWHEALEVQLATVDANGERGASSLRRDIAARQSERRALREVNPEASEQGCWHTHPAGGGNPSDQDIKAWSRDCDALGSPFIGLIVTSDSANGSSLWRPRFSAWAISRDEGRPHILEPVEIVGSEQS
jgi:proteasome lid subunit RPN8/RPN11